MPNISTFYGILFNEKGAKRGHVDFRARVKDVAAGACDGSIRVLGVEHGVNVAAPFWNAMAE